ncbi:MAG: HDIG domain-containing protein [Dysgonamonadaceae bacterium]|jgi:uncharacterized protein|nr:HDIG domain-containing protein [Dysgonamonadaceae bacterium]
MVPEEIIKKYYKEGSELYNILFTHSLAVADRALEIANMHPELNFNKAFLYEAAMVHDIGIFLTDAPQIHCFGKFRYICHGYLGAEIMRKEGFEKHAPVCERHTGSGLTKEDIIQNQLPLPHRDMLPVSPEEKLICFADKFYSKSHLERVKTVEQVRKSLSKYGDESVERFNEMLKFFLG